MFLLRIYSDMEIKMTKDECRIIRQYGKILFYECVYYVVAIGIFSISNLYVEDIHIAIKNSLQVASLILASGFVLLALIVRSQILRQRRIDDKLDVDEQLRTLPVTKYRENLRNRKKKEIIALYKMRYEGQRYYTNISSKQMLGTVGTVIMSVALTKMLDEGVQWDFVNLYGCIYILAMFIPLIVNIILFTMESILQEKSASMPSFEKKIQDSIVEELFAEKVGTRIDFMEIRE